MRPLILIAGLMVGLVAQAEAARNTGHFHSGNTLSGWCDDDERVGLMLCGAYVNGIVDTLAKTQERVNSIAKYREAFDVDSSELTVGDPLPSPCLPVGITGGQMRKVVTKYLNENPANLHHGAAILVYEALSEAFPCPEE